VHYSKQEVNKNMPFSIVMSICQYDHTQRLQNHQTDFLKFDTGHFSKISSTAPIFIGI